MSLVAGAVNTGGHAQGDVLIDIEDLTGSRFADTLIGNDGANRLAGGPGGDRLLGGAGQDTADYSGSDAAVVVSLVAGAVNTGGHAEGDVLIDIEDLTGSEFDDNLYGNAGDNRLEGGRGHDYLFGDAGADVFVGGPGADTMDGGTGNNTVDYSGSAQAVNVTLWFEATNIGGDAEGDRIMVVPNVIGSAWNDTLTGGINNNLIEGRAGHDFLTGLAGRDTLDGGAGIDTANYSSSAAAVSISLVAGTWGTGGDAQWDRLIDIENLRGSAHSDTLIGNAGAICWKAAAATTPTFGEGGTARTGSRKVLPAEARMSSSLATASPRAT